MKKAISPQYLAYIRQKTHQAKVARFNCVYEKCKRMLSDAEKNPLTSKKTLCKIKNLVLLQIISEIRTFSPDDCEYKNQYADVIYANLKALEIAKRCDPEDFQKRIDDFIKFLIDAALTEQLYLTPHSIQKAQDIAHSLNLLDPINLEIPFLPVFNKLDTYQERYSLHTFLIWLIKNKTDPLTRCPIDSFEQIGIDMERFIKVKNLWRYVYKKQNDEQAYLVGVICLAGISLLLTNVVVNFLQNHFSEELSFNKSSRLNIT